MRLQKLKCNKIVRVSLFSFKLLEAMKIRISVYKIV